MIWLNFQQKPVSDHSYILCVIQLDYNNQISLDQYMVSLHLVHLTKHAFYKNTVQVAKMMRQGAFMQKAINSLIKMLDEGKKDQTKISF